MNDQTQACVFKNCANEGETRLALTTGPMHYLEDRDAANGSMVFWVCSAHLTATVETLATSWDGQRVTWEADEADSQQTVLPEHPSLM